ncbi:MAG TPA: hypothetical protein VJV04_07165, partial [Nitrospiraceae bacterium]|nr:hypothetical protein [Nitrospiraceae bacterium]
MASDYNIGAGLDQSKQSKKQSTLEGIVGCGWCLGTPELRHGLHVGQAFQCERQCLRPASPVAVRLYGQ